MAGYFGRTLVMPIGDSITAGTGSTGSLNSAGYRSIMNDTATSFGRSIKFVGSQNIGTFTNNACEGYPGATTATIQASSLAPQMGGEPDIILSAPGTNDLGGGATAAQLDTIYTTYLNSLWDRAAHYPGRQSPLRAVICSTILKRNDDLVVLNPKVIDFNTNHLPAIVANQVALGRDVVLVDGYTAVTSFSVDNIHPNDAGYQQWLPIWLQQLMPRLRVAA